MLYGTHTSYRSAANRIDFHARDDVQHTTQKGCSDVLPGSALRLSCGATPPGGRGGKLPHIFAHKCCVRFPRAGQMCEYGLELNLEDGLTVEIGVSKINAPIPLCADALTPSTEAR